MAASAPPDADTARRAAREILSRPEFDYEQDWLEKILGALSDPVGALFEGFGWLLSQFPEGRGGAVLAWAIAMVFATIVCFAVYRFTRSVTSDESAPINYAPQATSVSVAELLGLAAKLEGDGDWRGAIRARYAALVASLAAAGLVRHRPGRTTGEYVEEVRVSAPEAVDAFTRATRLFEWAWYGRGAPTENHTKEFRHFSEQVQSVVAS